MKDGGARRRRVVVLVGRRAGDASAGVPRHHHGTPAYWDVRDRLAADLLTGRAGQTAEAMVEHAHRAYGVGRADAAEHVERFFAHIGRALARGAGRK